MPVARTPPHATRAPRAAPGQARRAADRAQRPSHRRRCTNIAPNPRASTAPPTQLAPPKHGVPHPSPRTRTHTRRPLARPSAGEPARYEHRGSRSRPASCRRASRPGSAPGHALPGVPTPPRAPYQLFRVLCVHGFQLPTATRPCGPSAHRPSLTHPCTPQSRRAGAPRQNQHHLFSLLFSCHPITLSFLLSLG